MSTVSATSTSNPSIFEILSNGDITFVGASSTKMQVIGAEEFSMTDGDFVSRYDQSSVFSSGGGKFYAPVHLPDGATVTGFGCYFQKFNSNNFLCSFLNSPAGSSTETVMASVNTNSITPAASTPTLISTNTINDPNIDRDTKNYFILFEIPAVSCATQCRLESAKITYTVPSGFAIGGNFYPVDNV